MSRNRPFVLTIAGFDPSGGAGVLADCKTFEQHQVYGLAINTGNTIQTEKDFFEIEWTSLDFVLQSIKTLFGNYDIKVVKIGIVPSLLYLKEIIFNIKELSSKTQIVWDTVLKSSTEFDFITVENKSDLSEILSKIDLITPNYNEIKKLFPDFDFNQSLLNKQIQTAILLKGGHNTKAIGTDHLYSQNEIFMLPPNTTKCYAKHGSGCVLSSAITANLALGQDLKSACINAKNYIEKYLNSSSTLIGYHYVQ
ncbi:hydroxymethylpyrimidine/phosphomethylpyrimidine kinase [Flavobacterium sp. LS1R47]|jgi:hydroxymethylpyrimidine/phosphomethylpyrimidine kinase|uniref:hydroxymethylpyrimidine kinase n=1 Tax=Flavobacterium frigoritolerans TaxID=2987686 RepID=A0A9X3C9D9_9FLAO|nr:hydroxymethylpyrimidine/phosphomethylpyrimidine kinase [Flavobacterium frigoritolerans]MCV9934019.1 hydroxymethylpyrimidine/phosphomethylpyrimidine kinase [Flavobacterium frigoritolerans]